MIDYAPPYLNLKRRISIMPPTVPLREIFKKLKESPVVYPPELLKARRETFAAQIKQKVGQVAPRPTGS